MATVFANIDLTGLEVEPPAAAPKEAPLVSVRLSDVSSSGNTSTPPSGGDASFRSAKSVKRDLSAVLASVEAAGKENAAAAAATVAAAVQGGFADIAPTPVAVVDL